jgi:hypothetical protein
MWHQKQTYFKKQLGFENVSSRAEVHPKIFYQMMSFATFFGLFRLFSFCFGSIETTKLPVSILNRNNRNKRLVSDSFETSFGSSFGCFESKLVSQDTLHG